MTEPVFYNKDGRLNGYALACGYVEKMTVPHGEGTIEVTLFSEHDHYHIRAHNFDSHRRLVWNVRSKLVNARREYDRVCKQVREGGLY